MRPGNSVGTWPLRKLAPARLTSLRRCVAFDDAEVQGWEGLEGTFGLPDPNDEHVVAAAAISGAGAIVTHNLRDFPSELLPHGLEVLSPVEFAANTVALDPARAMTAACEIALRTGRQGATLTVDDVLDMLVVRYGLDEAVASPKETR